MLEIKGFKDFDHNVTVAEVEDSNMVLINLFIKQPIPTTTHGPFASILIKDYPEWSDEFLDYLESDKIYDYPGDFYQLLDELIEICGVDIVKKGTNKHNEITKFLENTFAVPIHDTVVYIDFNNHDDPSKKIKCGNHDILIMADNIDREGILQPIQNSPNFSVYNVSYLTSEKLHTQNNKLFVYADIYSTFHYDVAIQEDDEISIKFIRNNVGVTSDFKYSVYSNPEKLFQHKQFVTDVDVSWLPYAGREHLLNIKDMNVTE